MERVLLKSRVADFVEFVFLFSFYLNRTREFFDLRGELLVSVRFKEGDVEGVVYGHRGWGGQLISACSNFCKDSPGSDFVEVQFLQWFCIPNVG